MPVQCRAVPWGERETYISHRHSARAQKGLGAVITKFAEWRALEELLVSRVVLAYLTQEARKPRGRFSLLISGAAEVAGGSVAR